MRDPSAPAVTSPDILDLGARHSRLPDHLLADLKPLAALTATGVGAVGATGLSIAYSVTHHVGYFWGAVACGGVCAAGINYLRA
ncbi:hypothetical protein QFZ97_001142 [Paraburkholderia youngii]